MKIEKTQKFIDKFRYNQANAALVQSRIKQLKKIEQIEIPKEGNSLNFHFNNPEKIRPPVIKIENGFFNYESYEVLLENLNINIDLESRIALLGSNGTGKTTLLKIFNSNLNLTGGEHYQNPRSEIVFISQYHDENLDFGLNPIEQFNQKYPKAAYQDILA